MQPRSHSPVGASPSVTHSLSLAPTTVAVSHSHPSDIRLPHTVPLPLTRCLSHTRLSLSSLYSLSLTLSRCLSHSLFLPLDVLYSRSEDPPSCNAMALSLLLPFSLVMSPTRCFSLSLPYYSLKPCLSHSMSVSLSSTLSFSPSCYGSLSLSLSLDVVSLTLTHSVSVYPPPPPHAAMSLSPSHSFSLTRCLSLSHPQTLSFSL